MIRFKGHEIHEVENDYVEIILYLDHTSNWLEEFSTELGHKNESLEVQKAAHNYVKKHLPKTKFKKIKVMAGVLIVATMIGAALTVPAGNQVSAAEVGITGGPLAVDEIT